jgi:hypothetical protein
VHLGCVLDRDHVLALTAGEPHLGDRSGRIFEQPLLERRIGPCACHDLRAVARPDLALVRLDDRVERCRVDQTFFHQQRFQCLHSQSRVGRKLRMLAVLVRVMVFMRHKRLQASGCTEAQRHPRQYPARRGPQSNSMH